MSPAIRSFADLRLKPTFASHSRTPQSIAQIFASCETWAGARAAGNLFASHHRRHIVDHFVQELIAFTCGNEWLAKENLLNRGHLSIDELAYYVTTYQPMERGITATLKCLAQSAAEPACHGATAPVFAGGAQLFEFAGVRDYPEPGQMWSG